MKTFCDLKFRDNIDGKLVTNLTKRWGFKCHSRNVGNWIIYRRYYGGVEDAFIRQQLVNECNRLCEPYTNAYGVVSDLNEIMDVFKSYADMKADPTHKQFILEWAKNNIESVKADIVPWED